ncbi:hypothetical protein ACEXQE_06530 [Herbiconiux sp. P17]|uniref:hypothetical protein n=1 Tax=Herbiconiux wuyangfengii TaxID=3342794 RepID=UPI0035B9E0B4
MDFFAVLAVLTVSLWPSPYRSESVTVEVSGAMRGTSYDLGEEGVATSTVGSDDKGLKFSETTFDIPIRWAAGSQERATPRLTAILETATGDLMTCGQPGGVPRSGGDEGTVQLRCSIFVSFDQLHGITSARVTQ